MKAYATKEHNPVRSPAQPSTQETAANRNFTSFQNKQSVPVSATQLLLARVPNHGPVQALHRNLQQSIDHSPRQMALSKKLPGMFPHPFQRKKDKEELQMRANVSISAPAAFNARNGPVQRQILGESGFDRYKNPAKRHAVFDFSLGFTPPTVNSKEISKAQDVVDAFKGENAMVTVTENASDNFSASVNVVPTNHMGYMMHLPTPGPWISNAPKKDILSLMNVQDNGRNLTDTIKVEVTGPKGHEALEKQIEDHEMVHAKDNERIRDQIFKPWDEGLTKLKSTNKVFQGGSAEIASNALWSSVGGTLAQIAGIANQQWGHASDEFHNKKKGKTKVDDKNTRLNEDQTKAVFSYYLTI